MTIDETGQMIALPAPIFDLENTEMLRDTFNKLANTIVAASGLALEIKELRGIVEGYRREAIAAHEAAVKAIEERNEAFAAAATAQAAREIADAAYQTVNGQRIAAETELTEVRQEIKDLRAERDLYKEEVERINRQSIGLAETYEKSLKGATDAYKEEMERLRAELKETEERRATVSTNFRTAQDELLRVCKDRDSLQDERDALSVESADLHKLCDEQQADIEKLQKKLQTILDVIGS